MLTWHGKDPVAGWVGVGFFGPGALILLWPLLDPRPRLVVDAEGILDRTLGVGRIPWADILGWYVQSIAGSDFICLVVRDPASYAARLTGLRRLFAGANRAMGFTDLSLNLSGLNVSTEQILSFMEQHVVRGTSVPDDRYFFQ
jgi:hypothetical protein